LQPNRNSGIIEITQVASLERSRQQIYKFGLSETPEVF